MFVPISNYIEIARISQYLAANDIANNKSLKGGDLNPSLARLLYLVRRPIERVFNLNPNDPTLNATALYMYALCGRYVAQAQQIIANQSASFPVISNPSNQSIQVGANATFTVTVTSSIDYILKWYRNGIEIPGATSLSYTLTNAQLSDNGASFSAVATNAVGSASSNAATLTVTQNIVAYYYYGTNDYSSQLKVSIDNVPFVGTFPVTPGQPLSFTWPSGAADNKYIVVKYPATESIKTTYSNAPINNGLIPSLAIDSIVTFGGWNYIFSRTGNPFSQNTSNPLIFT